MEGARRVHGVVNGGVLSPRMYGRPIPKRGRVKVAILLGLAHSVASIFSLAGGRRTPSSQSLS